jgi:hypothetical protein
MSGYYAERITPEQFKQEAVDFTNTEVGRCYRRSYLHQLHALARAISISPQIAEPGTKTCLPLNLSAYLSFLV